MLPFGKKEFIHKMRSKSSRSAERCYCAQQQATAVPRPIHRAFPLLFVLPIALMGQMSGDHDIPIKHWEAPLYWQPTRAETHANEVQPDVSGTLSPQATTPTSPAVFIAITPCRVVDTRSGAGFTGAFGPPSLSALGNRTFPIQSSTTCSIPASALAYSFNVTVVPIVVAGVLPPGYLGFLTIYPTGQAAPNASTLNNYLGTVVANAAIVPGGNNGSVDVYSHDQTDLIIDINGYYVQGAVGASQWTTAGPNIYYPSGNVGIDTATPSATLEVNGTAKFDGLATFAAGQTFPGTLTGVTANGGLAINVTTVGLTTSCSSGQHLSWTGSSWQCATPGTIAGTANTAVGSAGLAGNSTGHDNTAIGFQALFSNVSGNYNTASGSGALYSNTINGNGNTANGYQALYNNSTASFNTAGGYQALYSNTAGYNNTASGYQALYNNIGNSITGNNNTASGYRALYNIVSGYNNTASGSGALSSATGTSNIGIGFNAGVSVTSGNFNIMIGNGGLAGDDHAIKIGDVQMQTFIAGISGVNVSGAQVLVNSSGQLGVAQSSRRFKEDIRDMGDDSQGLLRLRPVTFRYKQPFADGSKPLQYGLVAEEVAEVYPDLVARSADGQIETVKYQVLDSMLLNEVERQQEEIRSLQERLARLETLLEQTSTRTASR